MKCYSISCQGLTHEETVYHVLLVLHFVFSLMSFNSCARYLLPLLSSIVPALTIDWSILPTVLRKRVSRFVCIGGNRGRRSHCLLGYRLLDQASDFRLSDSSSGPIVPFKVVKVAKQLSPNPNNPSLRRASGRCKHAVKDNPNLGQKQAVRAEKPDRRIHITPVAVCKTPLRVELKLVCSTRRP